MSEQMGMGGQNPYEAPKADVNLGGLDPAAMMLNNAGSGARFLNFLIDNVLVVVIGSIAVAIMIAVGGPEAAGELGSNAVAIGVMVGYYLGLEALFGWTIGKLVTGTRVRRVDGSKPSFGQLLGRTAARFIPFEPFSVLFGGSSVGWHDSLSGTRVVRIRR